MAAEGARIRTISSTFNRSADKGIWGPTVPLRRCLCDWEPPEGLQASQQQHSGKQTSTRTFLGQSHCRQSIATDMGVKGTSQFASSRTTKCCYCLVEPYIWETAVIYLAFTTIHHSLIYSPVPFIFFTSDGAFLCPCHSEAHNYPASASTILRLGT